MTDELLLGVASLVSTHKVKICQTAAEKSEKSPFGGAFNFKGSDLTDDPLRSAALLTIALTLEPSEVFEDAYS
jgi:hypothetical protein